MSPRRKLTDAQREFVETGDVPEPESTGAFDDGDKTLEKLILGDRKRDEPSIRFTVDLPQSLNDRLANLSRDSRKPKTELVRIIIREALEKLDY